MLGVLNILPFPSAMLLLLVLTLLVVVHFLVTKPTYLPVLVVPFIAHDTDQEKLELYLYPTHTSTTTPTSEQTTVCWLS